jgi:tetratricopeptide (TPR) repeat protein
MCHAELQDYDEAIADYSVAIRLNPGESKAYVARADAYRRSGNYNPAISDLSRVIELKPYAEAYLTRGEVYEEKGRPDTAIFDFTRAIELDSTSARAYDRRARAFYATGQPDSARLDWQKAHKLDDDYPSSPEGKRLLMQKR